MNREKLDLIIAKGLSHTKELDITEVTKDFVEKYYYYLIKFIELENMISIDRMEQLLDYTSFSNLTKQYLEWFDCEGEPLINYVLKHLNKERLNDKARSFDEYYSFMLSEAIEQKNLELLLNHLYHIPKVMKEEYVDFGFLIQRRDLSGNYLEELVSNFVWKTVKGPKQQAPYLV